MTIDAGAIVYTIGADTSGLLRAEGAVKKTTTSIKSALTSIAAGVSIGILASKLVSVQRKFDKLNSSVLTATGSIKNANDAMLSLQKFATETPYGIEQSVEAFTKLVNFGLTPSEEAMRSFGDTSAALGKDLVQMIEAVADAATGEFERLKEFGIKSKNQGDTIAFTFRGTTEVVKNSASEIEKYLIDLGKNNFAGAMANRMKTLDGSISMFDDSLDNLFKTMGEMDGGTMVAAVSAAKDAIDALTFSLQSGQLTGYMNLVGDTWHRSLGFIIDDIGAAADIIALSFKSITGEGRSSAQLISDAFFHFPINIKTILTIATAELKGFVDKAAIFGEAMAKSLNPFNDYDRFDAMADINASFKDVDKNIASSTLVAIKNRNIEIRKVKEQSDAIDVLVDKYKEEREAKISAFDASGGLGKFKANADVDPNAISDSAQTKGVALSQSVIQKGLSPEEKMKQEMLALTNLRDTDLENRTLHETAITSLIEQQEKKRQDIKDEQSRAELNRNNMILAASGNLFGSIAGLLESSGEEQSSAYKAMFAISKAFAIAQATMNLSTAISQASILPFPVNIPAMAAAAASGASLVSAIGGATYAGGRQFGGGVSGGNAYRMGEDGPEILKQGGKNYVVPGQSGEVISNKDLQGGGTTININNMASGVDVQATPSADGKTIDIAVRKAVAEITNQFQSGNGSAIRALRGNTNVTSRASQ